jgi:hypothetical protein
VLPPSPWTTSQTVGYRAQQGTSREYDTGSLIRDANSIDPAGSGYIINPTIPDTKKTCGGGNTLGAPAQLIEIDTGTPSAGAPLAIPNSDGSLSTTFSGQASDPNILLSSVLGPIQWSFTVTISSDGSTASITGNHTCFPAHEVYVNGIALWQYGPNYGTGTSGKNAAPLPTAAPPSAADNDWVLLTRCLTQNLNLIPVSNSIKLK